MIWRRSSGGRVVRDWGWFCWVDIVGDICWLIAGLDVRVGLDWLSLNLVWFGPIFL